KNAFEQALDTKSVVASTVAKNQIPPWIPDHINIRGHFKTRYALSTKSWFGTGGFCDFYFEPYDEQALAVFLHYLPIDIPVCVLGCTSNVIIRDGGIKGVVIKLGAGFSYIEQQDKELVVGASTPDRVFAKKALRLGLSGCEFFAGIPGSIGGGVVMNAGAYGGDVSQILKNAKAFDRTGKSHHFDKHDFEYSYRSSKLKNQHFIFVSARFELQFDDPDQIKKRIEKIDRERKLAQPVGVRTGGSTFKNTDHYKAWQLIDQTDLRGVRVGGAHISAKHCNFMINDQNATGADLEMLGELVRVSVYQKHHIMLEWEIERLGRENG
ncbi:MAG: UDP-N-acetylmuramate dehydrogenase, partial [Pseudomonadota bacterium]